MPEAGGDYVYLSRGLGSLWGFLFGWMTVLIQRPASAATIAAGLLRLAGFIFPSLNAPIFTWHIPAPFRTHSNQFTFTAAQSWAVGVIAAMAAINYLGVRSAGRAQTVLTGLKVAAIASIVVLGLTLGKVNGIHSQLVATSPPSGGVGDGTCPSNVRLQWVQCTGHGRRGNSYTAEKHPTGCHTRRVGRSRSLHRHQLGLFPSTWVYPSSTVTARRI